MATVQAEMMERSQAGWLPVEVTGFVGRRYEIAEVKRLMSESRVVTLTGVGGVGKTRLALRVARDVRRAFPDGVWLVELAGLEKPELLLQSVTEALDIRDRSSRPPMEVLVEHLRDKRALLLLDNCEHLLPEVAVMAETLVRSTVGLRILATSRQALGAAGERMLPVTTLRLPDPDLTRMSVETFMQCDAVRLFAERASAVVAGFAVTDVNQNVVEQICRRLDGIPLAIELAAVRLRALSIDDLLDRLGDRFRLLTAGSPAALPRQQTLRALIDWSYALCTERERLMWARASVFVGGLDLASAEEVCSGDGIARGEVVDLVIGLVEKSILIREEHASGVRYRLLETIRQYGRDRLRESGEETRLRRRHRDWYRDLALQSEREWFGPGQVDWFAWLRREHGNLRTAMEFCLTAPGEAPEGSVIAAALRFYWSASSLHEGRRWLDCMLAADPHPTPRRAWTLVVNARLAVLQSDFSVATAMLAESRELAIRFDDTAILAGIAYVSGLAALFQQDLTTAVLLLEEAVERHREVADLMGEVHSLLYLAAAHSFLDHSPEAAKFFGECLEHCVRSGDHRFTSCALCFHGIEVWRQGDSSRAVTMLQESVRLKQPFNDRWGITLCIEVMAWIAADQGDHERAARLLGALRGLWRSVGGPLLQVLTEHHDTCEIAARQGLGANGFDANLNAGAAMSIDEAVALAFQENMPAARPSDKPGEPQDHGAYGDPSPLTRRETEVALLVAQGMSNKEIASSLVIAQRTAEGHVEHILSKLGFSSRAQIAVWSRGQRRAEQDA